MTITSPSGRKYNWDKPTPPTAEDMAALQAYDAQQGGGKAPAQTQPSGNMGEVANLPGYVPEAGSPFQSSPVGVSGAPAFQKAAAVAADMGLEGGGAAIGQAVGAATGPAAPVAVPALGAIGGALGNAAGQIRGKIQGDRKEFSLGELLAAGVAGMAPGGSLLKGGAKAAAKEVAWQAGSNVVAKQAQVAADEGRMITPGEAAMAGGGGVLGVGLMKGLDKGVGVAKATEAAIQRAITQEGWDQARKAGYVLPPSFFNPSQINNMLESIGTKAGTAQEVALRNQEITNALANRALGMPSKPKITMAIIQEARDKAMTPYREVAALDGGERKFTKAVGFNISNETEKLPNGQAILDDLSTTRFEAHEQRKFYIKEGNPENRKAAEKLEAHAEALEARLEDMARKNGRPELVDELRQARVKIAKTYDVERALNIESGDISAHVLARKAAIGKKSPYTGELATISDFVKGHDPSFTRDGWKVKRPGISALDAKLGGALATAGAIYGGPGLAAVGLVAPFATGVMARNALLSKPYQNVMSNAFYGSMTQPDLSANAIRLAVEAGARK